jgi:hypothetical protein
LGVQETCNETILDEIIQPFLQSYIDLYPDNINRTDEHCYFKLFDGLEGRVSLLMMQKFFAQLVDDAFLPSMPVNMYDRQIEDTPITNHRRLMDAARFLNKMKNNFMIADWQSWLKFYQNKSPAAVYIGDLLKSNDKQTNNGLVDMKLDIVLYDRAKSEIGKVRKNISLDSKFEVLLPTFRT